MLIEIHIEILSKSGFKYVMTILATQGFLTHLYGLPFQMKKQQASLGFSVCQTAYTICTEASKVQKSGWNDWASCPCAVLQIDLPDYLVPDITFHPCQ